MIALTGANGQLGREVVKLLSQNPAVGRFRALARRPDEAQQANPAAKAEFVQADFDDAAGLTAALRGVSRLLLISTPDPNELRITRQLNALRAAKEAGVAHVIYLSFLVADGDSPFPFAPSHAATEHALREQFASWTILRPSLYLDALAMVGAETAATGAFRVPAGDAKVSFLARQDIARAAAAVLTTEGHAGKSYPLTGAQAYTYAEVAAIISEVTGRPVQYTPIGDEEYRQRVAGAMPPPMLDAFSAIWRTIREGWFAPVTPDAQALAGQPLLSVPEWVAEHRQLFEPVPQTA